MRAWEKNVNKSIESYLNSSYDSYKSYERFKFVRKIISKRLRKGREFLDIGCSKGEFIWYLKDFFPAIHFTGIDISRRLIALAKKEMKLRDATFIGADILNLNLKKEFDLVFMGGVLSIFDDLRRPLRKMIKHLKPGGWGYIFGCFTEDDIDVLVRYRNNYLNSAEWESGLNMFSLSTMRKALSGSASNIRFHRFSLHIDLPKNKNPVKSYTLNSLEKGRIVLNGANILNQLYLLEFKKL